MNSSMDKQPYPICLMSMMLFGLSAMLDTGKHDNITFDDVKLHSEGGDLIPFLKKQAGGDFASNAFDILPNFTRWYTAQIADICSAMHNRERRKYGLQRRGLCLLISYTAEILQSNRPPFELTDHPEAMVLG